MAKPIVLLGVPSDQPRESMEELQENMRRKLSDYHILVYIRRDLEIKMEIFNDKDSPEITIQELKEYINRELHIDSE